MRPVSTDFISAISGSHTMTARVTVVAAGQSGVSPSGTAIPIISGDVVLDGTAQVRGSLDLTTDGTRRWPVRAADLLAPYGIELQAQRGIEFGGGVTEWCSLGYFVLRTVDQDKPPDGPIRIEAKDRMQGVVDARLMAPVQFAASRTYGSVMTELITQVFPSAVIEWDDATDTAPLGRALIAEEKRYEVLNDLVTSVGKVWYWDHRGVLVIKDPPSVTSPVWEVNAGEGGVLVSMSRQLTRDGVYNAVVASGEATGTDTPARAVAVNSNPDSPTYFYGPFGPVPQYYSSPFLLDSVQAASAARAILTKQSGLPYNVDFSTVPNPALEPYDPVRVTYSTRDAAEIHVIEKLTVPLTESGALTANTREQSIVLIGDL